MNEEISNRHMKQLGGDSCMSWTVILLVLCALIIGACKPDYETVKSPVFVYNSSTNEELEYILITTPNLYAFYPNLGKLFLVDERNSSIQVLFADNDLIIVSEALPYQDSFIHVYYLKKNQHLIHAYEPKCTYDGGLVDFYQFNKKQSLLEWGCMEQPYRLIVDGKLSKENRPQEPHVEDFRLVEVQISDFGVRNYDTLLENGMVSVLKFGKRYGVTINSNKIYPIEVKEYLIEGL